jgi:hypothetical protein
MVRLFLFTDFLTGKHEDMKYMKQKEAKGLDFIVFSPFFHVFMISCFPVEIFGRGSTSGNLVAQ